MNIDEIITIHDEIVISEGRSTFMKIVRAIDGLNWNKAKKKLRDGAKQFVFGVKAAGMEDEVLSIINKNMGTRYRRLDDILRMAMIEGVLSEGIKDWWTEASGNLYGALSFYPILTAFLELDKVIKGTDGADLSVVATYALMWVAIVSGKVASTSVGKKMATRKQKKLDAKAMATTD